MTTPAASAQGAMLTGDLDAAFALATEAADGGDPYSHALLALLLYTDDAYDEARDHFQQAFRGLRELGDVRAAARAAIWLAGIEVSMHGHESAGLGWSERARELLQQAGPCVEWGYWELALLSCDRTDLTCLLDASERALTIAHEFGDPALEAMARADRGLARVTQGHIEAGFVDLEAAMTAVLSGEVPVALGGGLCLCAMLTACDRVGDVRRAERWTTSTRDLARGFGDRPVALYVHCRVAWGSVLRNAGRWEEAEQQLVEALGTPDRPFLSHRPLTSAHLASLRLDQGRLEEAAELLAPYEDRVTSSAPLALLHLRQGRPDIAAAVLRQGLAELVDDVLRAAPILAALVQVELARGDLAAASAAAQQLAELAGSAAGPAVRAEAAVAAGRLLSAAGDDPRPAFQAALRHLDERPFAAGLVRLELAQALAPTDVPAAVVEARAALACFTRLGATEARDRCAALLRELGEPGPRGNPGLGELTGREADVLALVQRGLTNAAIGKRLFISGKTVEHHVSRILAKLGVRSRAEAAALAVRLGAK
ncbi:MAG: LuxR C-terminal-related transcriptional regulator [Mycobacteriales bacterium]